MISQINWFANIQKTSGKLEHNLIYLPLRLVFNTYLFQLESFQFAARFKSHCVENWIFSMYLAALGKGKIETKHYQLISKSTIFIIIFILDLCSLTRKAIMKFSRRCECRQTFICLQDTRTECVEIGRFETKSEE